VRRVFDERLVRKSDRDGDGDVDEEDPAPVEVVGDVAAEGGADGGRDDDGESVEREGLAALLGREGVGEDGLLGGARPPPPAPCRMRKKMSSGSEGARPQSIELRCRRGPRRSCRTSCGPMKVVSRPRRAG
jgi:hypothetical protein